MSASTMPRDQAAAVCAPAGSEPARTYFFLTGENVSELLPRILLPFAKLGLAPCRIYASAEHGTGDEMSVELRFHGLTPDAAELLAAKCRAVIGVRTVMTTAAG
jgi:hypothetical protein